ncbi:MAG: MalY/PatB family protein [Nocardioides sp.]
MNDIGLERLRARGGLKWANVPTGGIGSAVAEMDFSVAEPIRAAIERHVSTRSLGYCDPDLDNGLLQACAEWLLRRTGWSVDVSRMRSILGVRSAFALTLRLLTRPGAKIVVPTPAYPPFLTMPPQAGREAVQVPMGGAAAGHSTHDLGALERELADPRTELLVLCNPHNPTGRVFDATELRALEELCEANAVSVVADEVWGPLVPSSQGYVPYASVGQVAERHSVTVLSAAKGWNIAGLGAGVLIVGSGHDLRRFDTAREHGALCASTLGAVTHTTAYTHGEPWLADALAYVAGNRRLLTRRLATEAPTLTVHQADGTYLAWLSSGLNVPTPRADTPGLAERAAAAGLLGGMGHRFGAAYRECLRLNLATPRIVVEAMTDRLVSTVSD